MASRSSKRPQPVRGDRSCSALPPNVSRARGGLVRPAQQIKSLVKGLMPRRDVTHGEARTRESSGRLWRSTLKTQGTVEGFPFKAVGSIGGGGRSLSRLRIPKKLSRHSHTAKAAQRNRTPSIGTETDGRSIHPADPPPPLPGQPARPSSKHARCARSDRELRAPYNPASKRNAPCPHSVRGPKRQLGEGPSPLITS